MNYKMEDYVRAMDACYQCGPNNPVTWKAWSKLVESWIPSWLAGQQGPQPPEEWRTFRASLYQSTKNNPYSTKGMKS